MNILWMAAIGACVLLEKVAPQVLGGSWLSRGTGAVLVGWEGVAPYARCVAL